MSTPTDYGRLFSSKSQFFWLLSLGRQFGQINFEAFGVFFGQFISTHFDTASPLSMLSINQPLFLQKLSLLFKSKTFILDWDLNLNLDGKELGI